MTHDQEPEVVAVWHTASAIGRRFEKLLADGTVYVWTEPPIGETYYPGEDAPDYNPICHCPRTPRAFCVECTGCADCEQCRCPSPALL
ncbi:MULTISPECIES: hypothetical protein [Streptomyces]|uniref:Uncharacterized protein n=2 Tax=Streptomyces TaxID=1883 RepID=A0A101PRR8_STRCK|nr:hypothetical protein [Streptomyces corchorusii]KUN16248.1 hypothetical protein AQJ11_40385 [Streptomyces corchorusii]